MASYLVWNHSEHRLQIQFQKSLKTDELLFSILRNNPEKPRRKKGSFSNGGSIQNVGKIQNTQNVYYITIQDGVENIFLTLQ
jgi:hypothetical protein